MSVTINPTPEHRQELRALLAFLNGEATLDGLWFGEKKANRAFWWRKKLPELSALLDHIERLEAALAYYADANRWQTNSAGITPAMDDRGHRARSVLSKEAGE